MPKLQLLSRTAQTKFDDSPRLTIQQRHVYFSINAETERYVEKIRNPIYKICFVLQLGYFKASGKFFANEQFRSADIKFVCNLLDVDPPKHNIDSKMYSIDTRYLHRKYILRNSGWQRFTNKHRDDLHAELSIHAKQQMHPKSLLPIATNYLINRKIELPMYYVLAEIITDVYNKIEDILVDIVDKNLSANQKSILDDLIWIDRKTSKFHKYSALSRIKQFSFSTKIANIQDSIKTYKLLKAFYSEFLGLYSKLDLSENATSYYSQWVKKAKLFQLKQFTNRAKAHLYILAHIKHQYFRHTDLYVDIFLKLVSNANNIGKKQIEKHNAMVAREQKKALTNLTASHKSSEQTFNSVLHVLNNPELNSDAKVDKAKCMIVSQLKGEEYKRIQDDKTISLMEKYSTDQSLKIQLLRSMGARLQRKLTPIICALEFEFVNGNYSLYRAISNYDYYHGKVQKDDDCDFLNQKEIELVKDKGVVNALAYKAALFSKTYDAIKAGRINLWFSYKYLALRKYLINDARWEKHRDEIINDCGLKFNSNFAEVICRLNERLNNQYEQVNTNYKEGSNKHLSFNKKGEFVIATPKTREQAIKNKLAPIFSRDGIIPIPRVLDEVNRATNFINGFKHHANKNVIMKPSAETIYAGILSKGCNHGLMRMANISKGISEDKLNNTINWFFSLENLQNANNSIIEYINKLPLPNIYKLDDKYSHTSSDGQKFNVGVDSILSNYSFKYFGQAQGISVYSFIDDRQVLFHSTVISPGEREAAFVIDGLMANNVVNSHIHSTDTHGYSEAIFATMHLLGFSFAPRIKKLGAQKLYCIDSKRKYKKNGYAIKFDSKINENLIKANWDDILRLIATIKNKTSTASQIFKRLNSYTKEPALYKALKEFGRIIKTIYIFTYLDDVLLRQRIEKQLNKIESSNKFARAVFFANSQEFRVGSTEEQMLIVACRVFIQNCIVLWNYLYLSQILAEQQDAVSKRSLLETIKKSSVISWRHINFYGEYDFTLVSNDGVGRTFDLDVIKKLNIA